MEELLLLMILNIYFINNKKNKMKKRNYKWKRDDVVIINYNQKEFERLGIHEIIDFQIGYVGYDSVGNPIVYFEYGDRIYWFPDKCVTKIGTL